MPTIDLTGPDAQRIRSGYTQYLGRNASNDEVGGWLGGQYGGGGVDQWLQQIQNSDEARRRAAQSQPTQQTASASSAPPAQQGLYQDARGQDIRGHYKQYLGRDASDDEVAQWWNQPGPGYMLGIMDSDESLERNIPLWYQEFLGRAATPYDVTLWRQNRDGYNKIRGGIMSSAEAQEYARRRAAGQNPPPPGTTPPPGGGGNTTTGSGGDLESWIRSQLTGVSSPQALLALESTLAQRGIRLQKDSAGNVRGRLYLPDGRTVDLVTNGGWGQPWTWIDRGKGGGGAGGVGGGNLPGNQYSDPYTQMLEELIKARIASLQGGYDDSMRQQLQRALQGRADALGRGNQQLDQLLGYLQKRFTDLKGPGYTGAENEVIRTGALDPLERDRAAAKKRAIERISAMGHTLESGVAEQIMQEIDREFDAYRGVTQNQLTMNDLNRREDRSQRAEMIGASIADIPDQRAREQLDVFQALEQLSLLARNEDQARSREAIGYAGGLNDLSWQRFQMAMQAAGMGGNPAQLGGMLTNMMGLNQNAAMFNQNNQSALWSGLGSLAAIIARSGRSGLSGVGI